MTKLLDKAVDAVRRMPETVQDNIARAMLQLANGDARPEPIDPPDLEAVLEGLAQARCGEFASDETVKAAFHRFGK